jgi:hypothetical protein
VSVKQPSIKRSSGEFRELIHGVYHSVRRIEVTIVTLEKPIVPSMKGRSFAQATRAIVPSKKAQHIEHAQRDIVSEALQIHQPHVDASSARGEEYQTTQITSPHLTA